MKPKKRNLKKRFAIWAAALGVATIIVFPKEIWEAVQTLKREIEREKKELSKESKPSQE